MPRIDLIPEVYYDAQQPYHWLWDNMPLRNIIARISLLNDTLEIDHDVLSRAVGTAGSLAMRLDASLQDNGHLIPDAVDATNHSIEAHTDTVDQSDFLQDDDDFVRMTLRERDKLQLIQPDATSLKLNFQSAGPSSIPVNLDNGTAVFADSVSTSWRYEAGKIYLDLNFPIESAHRHYYGVDPNNPSRDRRTYYVPLNYQEDSLRVYVNGVRINDTDAIYHPGATPTDDWVLNKYTVTTPITTKEFVLDEPLSASDVIKIDFEVAYLA